MKRTRTLTTARRLKSKRAVMKSKHRKRKQRQYYLDRAPVQIPLCRRPSIVWRNHRRLMKTVIEAQHLTLSNFFLSHSLSLSPSDLKHCLKKKEPSRSCNICCFEHCKNFF